MDGMGALMTGCIDTEILVASLIERMVCENLRTVLA
jgi:hypothetical protein